MRRGAAMSGSRKVPPSPAPGWLLEELKNRSWDKNTGGFTPPDEIRAGHRNYVLFRLGCKLRWASFEETEILSALLAVNNARCNPWLDEAEVAEIASKIVKSYPAGDPRAQWEQAPDIQDEPDIEDHDIYNVKDWKVSPLEAIIPGFFARGQLISVSGQTQANKSLLALYLAWKCVDGGEVFGRYPADPVQKALYHVLEDPVRRVKARLLDMADEFDGFPPQGRLRFSFNELLLYDPDAGPDRTPYSGLQNLEDRIRQEHLDIVFIDTFQRATPGVESFNDRIQAPIWHRLAKITRTTGATVITLDHFRKQPAGNHKGSSVGLDEVKGSGTKLQNCDGVILLEREGNNQLKLWAMNKDFDDHIGILLEVSGIGEGGPKFTFIEDLEAMGTSQKEVGEQNRRAVFEAMIPDEWESCPDIARRVDWQDSNSAQAPERPG